ncbi:uncharacterized protein B4U79_08668, partial [Dinothrombium tinctorium]
TKEITAALIDVPGVAIKRALEKHDLKLADFNHFKCEEKDISILIGADYYWKVVTGKCERISSTLVAMETKFGWCLHGPINSVNFVGATNVMKVSIDEEISNRLKSFWEIESIGIKEPKPSISKKDENVMKEFENSTRKVEGRYEVALPWKENAKELNSNIDVAKRRFEYLIKRFTSNPSFFERYKEVIESYLAEGFAEEVQDVNNNEGYVYYLPHQAVINEKKSTTKFRVVFDGSSHSKGNLSLNDCLYTGPNLVPDLVHVLINFRMRSIGYSADIKKAFLQILLRKQDRDATRFLWLKSNWKPGDKVEYVVLRMKRVLFGAASSPFLLAATVKHHIRKYRDQNEKICQLINNNLYVDDFLGSDDSEEEVNCIKSISSKILLEAGMELTKWVSNSQKLIIEWNESICDIHNFSVVTDMSSHKVLGICWDLENDWLTFNVENVIEFIQMKKDTKRSVLQASSRIFDPLGFLSPYTVQVKVLFQCLWEKGIQWDEELTDDLRSKWNEWCSQLHLLRSIKVERCLKVTNASSTELHIFCDSSIFAYGAVAYMRCEYENCKVKTTFVMSKSRVAPLKKMTLPRLELMGALIGARLAKYLNKLFQNKRIHLWTDSMITLHWIRGTAKRWKPFVENRIAEIHEHTDPSNWSYCEGTTNPADKLTRGLNVNELEKDYLWWNGPRWLKLSRDQWPKVVKENFKEEIISNELRKSSIVSMLIPQTKESIFPLNKY